MRQAVGLFLKTRNIAKFLPSGRFKEKFEIWLAKIAIHFFSQRFFFRSFLSLSFGKLWKDPDTNCYQSFRNLIQDLKMKKSKRHKKQAKLATTKKNICTVPLETALTGFWKAIFRAGKFGPSESDRRTRKYMACRRHSLPIPFTTSATRILRFYPSVSPPKKTLQVKKG